MEPHIRVKKCWDLFAILCSILLNTIFFTNGPQKIDGGLVSGQNGQNFAADLSSIVVWPGDLIFVFSPLTLISICWAYIRVRGVPERDILSLRMLVLGSGTDEVASLREDLALV